MNVEMLGDLFEIADQQGLDSTAARSKLAAYQDRLTSGKSSVGARKSAISAYGALCKKARGEVAKTERKIIETIETKAARKDSVILREAALGIAMDIVLKARLSAIFQSEDCIDGGFDPNPIIHLKCLRLALEDNG